MPMIPSGRHVAIVRNSLNKLLNDATHATNVHRVLAIRETTDIYAFTDVVWLLPEGQASEEQMDAAFLDASLPRPTGLVPVKSGYYLSQFEEFADGWSDEDKAAFWDFINIRAAQLFTDSLELARKVQHILRTQAEGSTKVLVAWWDAGVHPLQDATPSPVGVLPEWDDYDMLAAIGQMRKYMQNMQVTDRLKDDQMRETAMWAVYSKTVQQLCDWPDLTTPTRAAAQAGRAERWLDCMNANARATLYRQCVFECTALCDHFGPQLETEFPGPFEILNLVAISPESVEYFNP